MSFRPEFHDTRPHLGILSDARGKVYLLYNVKRFFCFHIDQPLLTSSPTHLGVQGAFLFNLRDDLYDYIVGMVCTDAGAPLMAHIHRARHLGGGNC